MSIRKRIVFLCVMALYLTMIACNCPTDNEAADTLTDVEGNVYHTIKVGSQVWMVENLRVTKYTDGSPIPLDTSSDGWASTSPKYCTYNNTTNVDSIKKHGVLYNWYVVDPANSKKIAPAGWHVPSEHDWDILRDYLIDNGYNWDGTKTDNKIAKSLAAKSDWFFSRLEGRIGTDLSKNNASGFTALPSGSRVKSGMFSNKGFTCHFWSTTETDVSYSWFISLNIDFDSLRKNYFEKPFGYSVRLVRD